MGAVAIADAIYVAEDGSSLPRMCSLRAQRGHYVGTSLCSMSGASMRKVSP
jgi:hypothetical protein